MEHRTTPSFVSQQSPKYKQQTQPTIASLRQNRVSSSPFHSVMLPQIHGKSGGSGGINGGMAPMTPSVGPADFTGNGGNPALVYSPDFEMQRTPGGAGYSLGFPPSAHYPAPEDDWDDSDTSSSQNDASYPIMRQHAHNTPMLPKVAIGLQYDFSHLQTVTLPMTRKLVLTKDTRYKPLVLHFPRSQLSKATKDQISLEHPRGKPDSFGHIDEIHTWRIHTVKFVSVSALLDGKTCKLPLTVQSDTQQFLNNIIAPDMSRVCLVLVDGKLPTDQHIYHLDKKLNRDPDLMNLVGAYNDVQDLWDAEVFEVQSSRAPWYGTSMANAHAVDVSPSGLIHAAVARVLGEERCSEITLYPLNYQKRRTLTYEDAAKGLEWLRGNWFRMCPPQRLREGMRFSVKPMLSTTSKTDSDTAGSDEQDNNVNDGQYDDIECFNMHEDESVDPTSNKIGSFDWFEWLGMSGKLTDKSIGDTATPHVLQVTAVMQVTLRMCVHQDSNPGKPKIYDL
jgi:hypothetical protein